MIQHTALVVGVLMGLAHFACGTSCPEIRAQRDRFEVRPRTTKGADARLLMPYALMDRVIASQLARRPPVPVNLPTTQLGLDLRLSIALDRVSTRPAAAGQLGLTLHLGLHDDRERKRVLDLEVDTVIQPKLETHTTPELVLLLRPQDLGVVRPKPTADGARMLARWVRDNLPPFARSIASDEVIEALAQDSLDLVAKEVWPRSKAQLLGDEPLIDTRFALPDLPIRDLALSSSGRALVVDMTTDLADARPIDRAFDEVEATERMILRLSGGTAMGLVNRAMKRGEVPSRFDAEGTPKPDGIWEARVGWRGGSTPLVVHLWRNKDKCQSAEVAARLGLALQGQKVRVRVEDGKITSVAGPAFAEAFYWLENIFGDAMGFTFDTDAFVRFDDGDTSMKVNLAKIKLGENDLVLGLDLEP